GAKCGGRGASGSAGSAAVSRPSSARSDARASSPTPLALVARKLRRDRRARSSSGCIRLSLPRDELVEVEDGAGERDPRGGLGRRDALGLVIARQLRRLDRVRRGQLPELVEQVQQPLALLRLRLAAQAQPEAALQPQAR